MQYINLNIIEILVLIGFASIMLEVFVLSGIGILFLGLGSFTAASIIYFMPELAPYSYFILGLSSVILALLLMRPLKNWNNKASNPRNIDIVGSKVQIVESDIDPNKIGKVLWSGTIMNAKLHPSANEKALLGTYYKVAEIKGNVLILKPISE